MVDNCLEPQLPSAKIAFRCLATFCLLVWNSSHARLRQPQYRPRSGIRRECARPGFVEQEFTRQWLELVTHEQYTQNEEGICRRSASVIGGYFSHRMLPKPSGFLPACSISNSFKKL